MRQITTLILISLFSLGCSTKKKVVTKQREEIKEQTISKTETVQSDISKMETSVKNAQVQNTDKKDEKTDIQIIGKVDKENPVTYYNIVGNDTIDLLRITGNADFIFKRSQSSEKSSINNNSTTNTTKKIKSEKSLSNAVESVKNTVKEVQTKSVELVKKDLTFGTFVTFFFWGLAIIFISVLFLWLRKSTFFTSIFSNVKKYLK